MNILLRAFVPLCDISSSFFFRRAAVPAVRGLSVSSRRGRAAFKARPALGVLAPLRDASLCDASCKLRPALGVLASLRDALPFFFLLVFFIFPFSLYAFDFLLRPKGLLFIPMDPGNSPSRAYSVTDQRR